MYTSAACNCLSEIFLTFSEINVTRSQADAVGCNFDLCTANEKASAALFGILCTEWRISHMKVDV